MPRDVAILGAGIVGSTAALYLARNGARCVLIDAEKPFTGASLRNAGGLYFQLQPQTGTFGPILSRAVSNLAVLVKSAKAPWIRLQESLGAPLGTVFPGGVIVATDDENMAALRVKHANEMSLGIRTSLLDAGEVKQLVPALNPEVRGGVFSSEEGFCETAVLSSVLAIGLREANVHVISGAKPIRIKHEGHHRIELSNGDVIEADIILGCLGAFTEDLLHLVGAAPCVQKLPLQIFDVLAPRKTLPLFLRYAGDKLSLKQYESGVVVVGGGWPALSDPTNPAAIRISDESLHKNAALAGRIIPALQYLAPQNVRGAYAAWTLDGLPMIGRHPALPNLFLACGGNGFTLGPLYAEILTALAEGKPEPLPLGPFAPDRFASTTTSIELPPDG